jgi:hypothetical protein
LIPSKNALTFETKRLCVLTKTPLRFNQNSLTFYLKRKGVLKRMQGRFQEQKTASQSLTKGLYNAAFL